MRYFISTVFKIGLVLGALGQLKLATLYFMREAAREQERGLVSLSALNHALWDQPVAPHVIQHHSSDRSSRKE